MATASGNLRDGAGIAAWMVLGISFGYGAFWLTTGLAAGLLFLIYITGKARTLAEQKEFVSVNQLIDLSFGRVSGTISVLIILATSFLYSMAQVNVVGNLFSGLFGVSLTTGIVTTSAAVCVYLLAGGYRATVTTGIFQWIIILLILILPWFLAPDLSIDGANSPAGLFSPGFVLSSAFLGISFLVVASSPDLWQIVFASSSTKQARLGLTAAIPMYYLISAGLILFATSVGVIVGETVGAEVAFFTLFSGDYLPNTLAGLLGVFVIASVMSTLDSQVFVFTSSLSSLVLGNRASSSSVQMERLNKFLIVLIMAVLAVAATTIVDLVEFLFGAVTLMTILLPLMFVAVQFTGTSSRLKDFLGSSAMGIAVVIYVYLFSSGAFDNLILTLLPAAISGLAIGGACILVRLASLKPTQPSSES